MGSTEQTIFEQFSYWQAAIAPTAAGPEADLSTVFVGCGTSYNLALSLAALAQRFRPGAIAVPGGEWADARRVYWPHWQKAHVIALSRSGETTETRGRGKGQPRCRCLRHRDHRGARTARSPRNCDRLVAAETHPARGHRHDDVGEPDAAARHPARSVMPFRRR